MTFLDKMEISDNLIPTIQKFASTIASNPQRARLSLAFHQLVPPFRLRISKGNEALVLCVR